MCITRGRAKEEAAERRRQKIADKMRDDADTVQRHTNNIAAVDGHRAYEIGCEPEKDYKLNIKKQIERPDRKSVV